MNVVTLTLGAYGTNCYLVWAEGSRSCAVIDPGYEPWRILRKIQALGLTAEGVLLTHGHFDHVGGVSELAQAAGCPVYLGSPELSLPRELTGGDLYYTDLYENGEKLTLGGVDFTVLSTPGHSRGSVCLLTKEAVFSGDTLFEGSCGRTDFPGGSMAEILASLKMLAKIPGDLPVYPGHGSATTLETERRSNPYLRGSL